MASVILESKRGCSFRPVRSSAGTLAVTTLKVGQNEVDEEAYQRALVDPATAEWFGPGGFIKVIRPAPMQLAFLVGEPFPSADEIVEAVIEAVPPVPEAEPERVEVDEGLVYLTSTSSLPEPEPPTEPQPIAPRRRRGRSDR